MEYKKFLETKKKQHISSGFKIDEIELNINLFDFQKHIVKIALQKGRDDLAKLALKEKQKYTILLNELNERLEFR